MEDDMSAILPSATDLDNLFRKHHGDPRNHGWRVRMRYWFGYFPSEQWYEGVVERLVIAGCRWIDVGGGKCVFPHNAKLARELADRCGALVGVDPSDNLDQNELVHERVKSTIEDFRSGQTYDLATLRMVAEHVQNPQRTVLSLARLLRPGGRVVIYTPNRWSPGSIVAAVIPNKLHHYFTRLMWNTHEDDVFPTFYRMNTRRTLRTLFEAGGFVEVDFMYLAACAVLARFRATCFLELCLWRFLHMLGIKYPENNLLGVYEKK
jgi:2-polyprenyl-3-methyl-5-hydroxy-6-metoxy-1,4-benzoquinol methylase